MAITLNRKWHSRLPELGNAAQCTAYGASCNNVVYAVALWSNPVARLLNGLGMLELRRMAIAPDAPKNTGSRMLRIMAAIIRRTRPDIKTLVSYQDTEIHTGCIYKAAGWRAIEKEDKRSRPWNHATRPRNEEQTRAEKVRWQITLRESANDQALRPARSNAKYRLEHDPEITNPRLIETADEEFNEALRDVNLDNAVRGNPAQAGDVCAGEARTAYAADTPLVRGNPADPSDEVRENPAQPALPLSELVSSRDVAGAERQRWQINLERQKALRTEPSGAQVRAWLEGTSPKRSEDSAGLAGSCLSLEASRGLKKW